jgi:hypothetical protein
VIASGSIGANTITIGSGKIFEGCGTINVGNRAGHGAIESLNTQGVQIPYLTMTGNPYFGLRFYGTKGLVLGKITMNLSGGLGSKLAPSQLIYKLGGTVLAFANMTKSDSTATMPPTQT